MRSPRLFLLASAVTGLMVVNTGIATARAQQDGVRIGTASAWFANPAQCAGGSCEAVFVTAMSGSLGFAANQIRYPAFVIVSTASATVVDGVLTPTSEPAFLGCTYDADVTVFPNLARATADTHGSVPLSDLTENGECAGPNGHYLALSAAFTGSGDVSSSTRRTQLATPWQHKISSKVDASRAATVTGIAVLDGTARPASTSSGWLARQVSKDTTVLHPHTVGTAPRLPLQVTPHSVLTKQVEAAAGDWTLNAWQATQGGVALKTVVELIGMVGDTFVWSEQPTASTISVSDDLSQATITATLPLASDAGPLGTVSVVATLTGVGEAWRWFDHVVGGDSYVGHGEAVRTGAQRDATSSLTVTGYLSFTEAGGGYLAEAVTKNSSSQKG